MNEQGESLIETPPPFEPSEDTGDFTDAPNDDPGAGVAVRFAGCTVHDELEQLGAKLS